mmetsp:Transcript_20314/g.24303  ORF Transcript_20314/g.24303 Transcript_20314/m.24303 type:complete len:611 (+) Transcript_20314:194-2026(+)
MSFISISRALPTENNFAVFLGRSQTSTTKGRCATFGVGRKASDITLVPHATSDRAVSPKRERRDDTNGQVTRSARFTSPKGSELGTGKRCKTLIRSAAVLSAPTHSNQERAQSNSAASHSSSTVTYPHNNVSTVSTQLHRSWLEEALKKTFDNVQDPADRELHRCNNSSGLKEKTPKGTSRRYSRSVRKSTRPTLREIVSTPSDKVEESIEARRIWFQTNGHQVTSNGTIGVSVGPTGEVDYSKLGLGNLKRLSAKKINRRRSTSEDPVARFLADISDTSLLSAEEEQELASRAQEYFRVEEDRLDFEKVLGRSMSPEEQAEKEGVTVKELREIVRVGILSEKLLIEHNLRLVIHTARHYNDNGVSLADLIQFGADGLHKSVRKFKPEKGFRFSTYTHWWILNEISRGVKAHARTIRLPVHLFEKLDRINRFKEDHGIGRDEYISDAVVGQSLGLPRKKVRSLLDAGMPLISLDSASAYSWDPEEGCSFDEIFEAPDEEDNDASTTEQVKQKELHASMDKALSMLQPRERNIICMRYGFGSTDGKGMTLRDVGLVYGVTKERVRQIEEKALVKLRQPQRREHLNDHIPEYAACIDMLDETFQTPSHTYNL